MIYSNTLKFRYNTRRLILKFTEEQLKRYAQPISKTEEEQCQNAVQMVAEALKNLGMTQESEVTQTYANTPTFETRLRDNSDREVKIFLQGSYANNTNVRQHSDVDIAVVLESRFYTVYREGLTDKDYNFSSVSAPRTFKDEVEEALKDRFGDDVERSNKCIIIHGNSYRKDADSVPALRYRNYINDYLVDAENYIGGIQINPDHGKSIINYPEQHIKNGIEKNKATNYFYKKMVRIAKEMRYQMIDLDYKSAEKTSSFGVECLLWNIPNDIFTKYSNYRFVFEDIVHYLYNDISKLSNYKEVNNIKLLIQDDYDRLGNYKNFIIDLKEFYDYEL